MRHATHAQLGLGSVVTLQNGALAIQVWTLDDGRLLVLTDGRLCAVLSNAIVHRPATCSGCGGLFFWWDEGHCIPWCLACIPPDRVWRTETLHAASAFAEGTGQLIPRWFMSWLAAQEHIGPGGWAIAQQWAFVGSAAGLVGEWYEREGLL